MILRRLTKHVKDQNWFAVGLDFLIVVIGVFVGMQVSNWNDAHQTQSERQLIETRLLSDFILMHEDVVRAAEGHEAVLESLHTLRRAIERGEALPEEDAAIKHALGRGFSYQSSIHRSGTFLELLSSGRMDLIADEALRVELLRYDTRAQRVLFNLNQIRNYMHSNMPNLNAYEVLAPLTRDERGRIILSPVQSYDIQGMAGDAEFRDALDLMIENQTWIQINVTGQVDALEDVLTVLQEIAP
ncbi:hypothetical protein [Hyphomonas sp.]|uniref:hypothetical protein n=1 Tax=Hyphomonas sp. TaxID=87 RepID=UPI000DF9DE39|nr:hypothetical protein [Hyphomonas sp.]RCL88720.1 MAG: hypothetical protein DBW63_03745 [Hyphomonas sp.]